MIMLTHIICTAIVHQHLKTKARQRIVSTKPPFNVESPLCTLMPWWPQQYNFESDDFEWNKV